MEQRKPSSRAFELLKGLPLLRELRPQDLDALAGETLIENLPAGRVIFYQGDPCERVYVVSGGRVKIVYHDRDGREVILEMISPGEMFGGAVLFFPSHPATAMTMEDSSIASFSADAYSRYLLNNPPVILNILRMLGARHLSMINMQIMAGERVERRMAHILLKLAARSGRLTPQGTLITISLSRQDLAEMACTTLETSIRTISRFQKDGLVSTQRGGYILVHDLAQMEEMAG